VWVLLVIGWLGVVGDQYRSVNIVTRVGVEKTDINTSETLTRSKKKKKRQRRLTRAPNGKKAVMSFVKKKKRRRKKETTN
jgi:hypothetical protein